jgi:hypothetical protein
MISCISVALEGAKNVIFWKRESIDSLTPRTILDLLDFQKDLHVHSPR